VIRIVGSESVVLMSLDNEPIGIRVESDSRLHVEVLPAKHLLVVLDAGDPSLPAQRVAFRAEAGKFYRPVFAASKGGHAPARVYEIDKESDALIRDVTLPADESESAAAPDLRQTPKPAPSPPAASASEALEVPTDAGPGSDAPAPASQDDAGTDSGR
jgi:hypothetical protein